MNDHEYYEQLISRMVDGELSSDEQKEIQNHIASCEECRALTEAFSLISSELSAELAEPPAEIAENVMAAVRRGAIVRKNRKTGRIIRTAAAVAACAALVIAGVSAFPRMGASSAAPADAPMLQMSMAKDSTAEEEAPAAPAPEPMPMPEEAPETEAAICEPAEDGCECPVIFIDEAARWISEKKPVTLTCLPDAEYEIQLYLDGELVTVTFVTAGDTVYYSPSVSDDGSMTAVPANCSLEEFNDMVKLGK